MRAQRRMRLFVLLGGARCRCGFSDVRALQFDHVKGRPGTKRLIGSGLFRDIERHPDKYQVLCSNCNWIKRDENGEVSSSVLWPEKKRLKQSLRKKREWKKNRKRFISALKKAWRDPVIRALRMRALLLPERIEASTRHLHTPEIQAAAFAARWAKPGARAAQARVMRRVTRLRVAKRKEELCI